MAQESDEAVAYLRALKQPYGFTGWNRRRSGARKSPASGSVAVASGADQQYQGTEKRRSDRYKREGSVEIQEDGCDVHTWATSTDVSLHGCYVEGHATYPVGAPLHLRLEANSVRVRMQGRQRARELSLPRHGHRCRRNVG